MGGKVVIVVYVVPDTHNREQNNQDSIEAEAAWVKNSTSSPGNVEYIEDRTN
jgi:hypothetical protein